MNHTCADCKQAKPQADFYKDKSKASGIHQYCKECARRRSNERYARKVTERTGKAPQRQRATRKPCAYCQQPFVPARPSNVCCSRECRAKLNARGRTKGKQQQIGVCTVCGNAFEKAHERVVTCSKTCSKLHSKELGRGNTHRRRARMKAVDYEPINALEVYRRDKWCCGICGEAIDPSVNYPHAASASIDHVTPIALGGSHTRDNVQAAHLGCNMKKGAAAA